MVEKYFYIGKGGYDENIRGKSCEITVFTIT